MSQVKNNDTADDIGSYDADDYTIGWITALPFEMAAAESMLDEVHENNIVQDANDSNSYILGRIQGHNIVVACLPKDVYGTTTAATVVEQMLKTFRSIRFGLMVGIGGGVPSTDHDIRLGDIVISQPTKTEGGVVQWDRGKEGTNQEFQRTGSLNAPPDVLLKALSRLDVRLYGEENPITQHLERLYAKGPKSRARWAHPGLSNDVLYKAEFEHRGYEPTCGSCDLLSQIFRKAQRTDEDPDVHYGIIASGNSVVKDGLKRDRIARDLGALCFEMEAAGLWQDFPCLVIRGICDYADSHKNKKWQLYAAAIAAACARELCLFIPKQQVVSLRKLELPKIFEF